MRTAALLVSLIALSSQPSPAVFVEAGDKPTTYHKKTCPMFGAQTPQEMPRAELPKEATPCDVCLPDGQRKVPRLRINKAKFADVYKASKAIDAATDVGVNKIRFSQLLQEFAAAHALLEDKKLSADEKRLADQYQVAISSYALLARSWDPDLKDLMNKFFLLCSAEVTKATEMYLAAAAPIAK